MSFLLFIIVLFCCQLASPAHAWLNPVFEKVWEKGGAAATAPVGSSSGTNFTEPSTGMVFVWVPGGCYQMGDTFGSGGSDEKPVHEVCVDGLYMGKYEVTQGQYKAIMATNPSSFKKGNNYPVELVSWHDAQTFINKLSSTAGKSFRLPTEAQWEYAARSGGKKQKYAGGNNVDAVAWYKGNSGSKTHLVGQKQANGLGLYDMSGNVWEWCQDWYSGSYYSASPRNNPENKTSSPACVIRGGSWSFSAANVRAANRERPEPGFTNSSLGFRLVFFEDSR